MAKSGFWAKRSLRVPDDKRTKAAELTLRESIYPIIIVTILFFLWGFSYGLLDTLNRHFQITLGIDKARSAGLQAAYFGAYPLASLGHAAWILRHFGYRAVFIWGLSLYGIGAVLAIPAIRAHSFGGFCTCIFIIGNGLGSLETAANPYITVCGPPKYAEIRINLSQAFNGIGAVMAPTLGSYVIFTFSDEAAIQNVQWIYLAIAIFVFSLAFVFFMSVIPEVTDADMDFQARETHGAKDEASMWRQYRLFHASFAQFCYCGAQVSIAAYFINYAQDTRPGTDASRASQFYAGAQGCFALGRFVGVGLMAAVRARRVFLLFVLLCFVFTAPALTASGSTGIGLLCATLFFESIQFPTIVALGMRGLGRHTKRGSGWIIAGVIGGAVFPPLTGYTADLHGTALAMVVPLMAFLGPCSYALCVNFVPWYRDTADAFTTTEVGLHGHHDEVAENGLGGVGVVDEESGGDQGIAAEKGPAVEKHIS